MKTHTCLHRLVPHRAINRLACWWMGHNASNPHYGCWCECSRCGIPLDPEYDSFYHYWGARQRWKAFWKRQLSFFQPCEECGRRFHRHDPSVEHMPF